MGRSREFILRMFTVLIAKQLITTKNSVKFLQLMSFRKRCARMSGGQSFCAEVECTYSVLKNTKKINPFVKLV